MHASSFENMQKCFERYVCGEWRTSRETIRVLNIGGADVNGTYADIFSETGFHHVAADVEDGPGVQLVLEDPYKIPYEDESVDLVISGQTLEHVDYFWDLFLEMSRVLKADGFIFLIAPSSGPIHRYPVDCYRFYPDAYSALAKYAGIHLVDCWLDDRGPWNDLVGVFSKTPYTRPDPEELRLRIASGATMNLYMRDKVPAPTEIGAQDDDVEAVRGDHQYLEVLQAVNATLEPRFYLEIGVRNGKSLVQAGCPSIGVDPDPGIPAYAIPNTQIYKETSDFFFEHSAEDAISGRPLDLVFIDGMHLFEFALRDFMNIERLAAPTTVVVIDDIFPNHPTQATRSRQSRVWTGDVWKLYHCLKTHRPDLRLFPIDAAPTGVLVIGQADPRNRVLWQYYNTLVRTYWEEDIQDYTSLILERKEARSATDSRLFDYLRKERENRSP